jgi:hypothetical protein
MLNVEYRTLHVEARMRKSLKFQVIILALNCRLSALSLLLAA